MKRVLIVYKYVPQYRETFFNQLRSRLADSGIDLVLVYGDPTLSEALKRDAVRLSWAVYVRSRVVRLSARTNLIYQPVVSLASDCDLVIVEQANRLLVNPVLLLLCKAGLAKLAFWGHGSNFQGEDTLAARWVKSLMARHVSWWFAYNELSAKTVEALGFPRRRITRVMNTIDSRGLAEALASVSDGEISEVQRRLGLSDSPVCLYIGGMYKLKRLDFLLDACNLIHAKMPEFRMVFVGSGVEAYKVEEFAAEHEWCRFVGAQFDRGKALYLRLAQLLLMPGLLGLAIIDSFVAGVPVVTTNVPYHSPEVEYLRSGDNGVMVDSPGDAAAYASKVVDLLRDDQALLHLRLGCARSAETYSMERMVERFSQGIQEALLQ